MSLTSISSLGHKYYFRELGLAKESNCGRRQLSLVGAKHSSTLVIRTSKGMEPKRMRQRAFGSLGSGQGRIEGRHQLGIFEGKEGNHDRTLRHLLI